MNIFYKISNQSSRLDAIAIKTREVQQKSTFFGPDFEVDIRQNVKRFSKTLN